MNPPPAHSSSRLWPFILLLAAFYSVYPVLARSSGGVMEVMHAHWPVSIAMVAGSFFAGSTPVGGGSVAFPILVVLFDQPAALGRGFSFAIQSLGMTFASAYVVCARRAVAWRFLATAAAGSAIATPIGCAWLAPSVPSDAVKLVFASTWCGFGCFALTRLERFEPGASAVRTGEVASMPAAFAVGAIGGLIASVIGGGADMLAFCYLVLRRRVDPRIAIPTGMMLMALASIAGLLSSASLGGLPDGVWSNWLAAAPIVVVGAPLGSLVVAHVPRRLMMTIVGGLCLLQFLWSAWDQRVHAAAVWLAVAGVAAVFGSLALFDRTQPDKR